MRDYIDRLLKTAEHQGFRLVRTRDNHLKVFSPTGALVGKVSQSGRKRRERFSGRAFYEGLRHSMMRHGFKG